MGRRIVTRGDIVITVVTAVAWSVALFGGVGHDCRAATFRGLGFPGPGPDSRGIAASADGSVVAGDSWGFPNSPRAHRWVGTNAPAQSGPNASWTFGLSADGNVVAGTHTPGTGGGDRAFRWVGGVSTPLPLLTGSNASHAGGYGISGDGNTAGHAQHRRRRA